VGAIKDGTATHGTTLFPLPAQMRPANTHMCITPTGGLIMGLGGRDDDAGRTGARVTPTAGASVPADPPATGRPRAPRPHQPLHPARPKRKAVKPPHKGRVSKGKDAGAKRAGHDERRP